MKKIALLILISTSAFAAEAPPAQKQGSIVVSAPKPLAEYNADTGEWKIEKGVKPEEVMTALLRELKTAYDQVEALKQPKQKKTSK